MNIACGFIPYILDSQINAYSITIISLAVGIVDGEAFESEISAIGWNDVDVAHFRDFVEARHHELCGTHLGWADKDERSFAIDDGGTANHVAANRQRCQGVISIGKNVQLSLSEENRFGLIDNIHFGWSRRSQHQAWVTEKDPRVVGVAFVGGMQVEDFHIAVE